MILPNFLLVGASKAGTSSIWEYLNSHPEITLPKPKEPLFFIYDVWKDNNTKDKAHIAARPKLIDSFEEYLKMFENVHTKLRGEASASYLYHYDVAIPNIIKILSSNTKIIIILRNPVDKVLSHFKFYKTRGWEPYSFNKALKLEEWRIKENYNAFYHYTKQGFYFKAVNEYKKAFKNVHICLYDDLKENPSLMMNNIFRFLGVDSYSKIDFTKKYNVSTVPKSQMLKKVLKGKYRLIKQINNNLNFIDLKKIKRALLKANVSHNPTKRISENEIKKLKDLYFNDVIELQELLGIDLVERWGFKS